MGDLPRESLNSSLVWMNTAVYVAATLSHPWPNFTRDGLE